jgi:hypothetical protein
MTGADWGRVGTDLGAARATPGRWAWGATPEPEALVATGVGAGAVATPEAGVTPPGPDTLALTVPGAGAGALDRPEPGLSMVVARRAAARAALAGDSRPGDGCHGARRLRLGDGHPRGGSDADIAVSFSARARGDSG